MSDNFTVVASLSKKDVEAEEKDEAVATEFIELMANPPYNNPSNFFTPRSDLVLGDIYRLEKPLGKGGMGEVWLAIHLVLGEFRAIKFLSPNFANCNESRQRFIFAEAKNALRLLHPNIVRVYDVGYSQSLLYIVMEYVVGSALGFDLKAVLRQKRKFSLTEANFYLQQIAAALTVAHERNLVHRDVKPANILVSADNTLKLTDFGIVKDLASEEELTLDGYGPGTPAYMAPEQAQGVAVPASDQYAIGIMLYEWLTGKPPFSGQTSELIIQHATVAPPPPSSINTTIPSAVDTVILKALAKRPEDRFTSVLELAMAFQDALSLKDEELTIAIDSGTEELERIPATVGVKMEPKHDDEKAEEGLPPAQAHAPNNLPKLHINKFIGRETEITEVTQLVREYPGRLITLSGPGGTGKTRLALQIAEKLLPLPEFKDGIFFAALENVTDRLTFISELISILELKDRPGQTLLEVLKNWLKDKELLLILDNFEQLVEKGATLVAELLKAAPKLGVIVTSRIVLQLSTELEYPVAPLALPIIKRKIAGGNGGGPEANTSTEPKVLANYGAVALFVERAKTAKNDFKLTNENVQAVIEICQRLDGLPLALELAAARVKLLTPQKIVERLNLKLLAGGSRDLAARQQTMRGAIDWSYHLLNSDEQTLFARMSIFVAGCTLEAVETVCNAELDLEFEPLEGIESLLQKSLLRQWDGEDGERRYGMLQIIREYSLEKLTERGETAKLTNALVSYYTEFAQKLKSKLESGIDHAQSLRAIDCEYENIREVLHQSLEVESSQHQSGFTILTALEEYWFLRINSLTEDLSLLEQAINLFSGNKSREYVKLLRIAGTLNWNKGDAKASTKFLEEALAVYQELGDKFGIADCLFGLGFASLGELAKATKFYNEALSKYRELGYKLGVARCLTCLSYSYGFWGRLAEAIECEKEALALFQEIGDKRFLAVHLHHMALTAYHQGQFAKAEYYSQESLALTREVNDERFICFNLSTLGGLAAWQGDLDMAARYIEENLALTENSEVPGVLSWCLNNLGNLAMRQGDFVKASTYLKRSFALSQDSLLYSNLGELAMQLENWTEATSYFKEALSLGQKTQVVFDTALALVGLGKVALSQADYATALKYFNEGLALGQSRAVPRVIAMFLTALATTAIEQDNLDIASQNLAESIAICQQLDDKRLIGENLASIIGLKLKVMAQTNQVASAEDLIIITKLTGLLENLIGHTNRLLLSKLGFAYFQEGFAKARGELDIKVFADAFQQGQLLTLTEGLTLISKELVR